MDEHARIFYGSLIVLVITGIAVVWGEAIGLTLFISHVGVEALPVAIIIEALLSMVFISSFEQIKGVIHDGLLVAAICLVGVGLLLAGKEMVNLGYDLGYGLYYAAQRILRDLLLFYGWNYLSSYYESHMRYLLNRLGILARISFAFGGITLAGLSLLFTVDDLVWMWLGTLLLSAIAIGIYTDEFHNVPRVEGKAVRTSNAVAVRLTSAVRSFFGLPIARLMSVGAFCMMVILSITFYKSAEIFWDAFSTEAALLRWLGIISSVFSLVGLPIQYIALPYILKSSSLKRMTNIYPLTTGLSFIGLMALPTLIVASAAEFTRSSLQLSLYDSVQNQMKQTLPSSISTWAHTFLDGFVEPIGRMLAGVFLVFLVLESVPYASVVILGVVLAAVFVYTEYYVGKLYAESLDASLSAGQYGFLRKSLQEQTTTNQNIIQYLLDRLKSLSPDDREVLLIAEALAETRSQEGFETLLGIWPRCSSSVQAELLMLLTEGWPQQHSGAAIQVVVAEALESDETKLRRAALKAMTIYPDLMDTFRVAQYLIDRDPVVSTAAGQLLLQYPGEQLAHAAQAQLNWLSKSSSPEARALAVNALVSGGVDRFGERVVPVDVNYFQRDRSARVRMSIVPAASLETIVYSACDDSPSVRRLAVKQLSQRRRYSTRLLLNAIERLRRTTPENFQMREVIQYWYLLSALAVVNRRVAKKRVLEELQLGLRQIDYVSRMYRALLDLNQPSLTPIVAQVGNDRNELLQALIAFVGAVYGSEQIFAIVRTIQIEPSDHACEAARATLSEIITPELAMQISTILGSPHENIQVVTDDPAWQPRDAAEVVRVLLTQNDEWFPLLSLYALSALPRSEFVSLVDYDQVEEILERGRRSQEDAIREGTRLLRDALRQDYAGSGSAVTQTRIISKEKEDGHNLLSTIERMLFLRNVTFFENLRLDQLRTLARICEELSVNEGEHVIRKGDAGDSLYIVVEGEMKVVDPDASGQVIVVRKTGDVLGEISLFDGGLRSADVIATTPSLLLVVYRDTLDNALADDPGIALDMLRAMAQLVRRSNQNLARLNRQLNPQELTD